MKSYLFLALLSLLLLPACKKNNDQPAPVINSVVPLSGPKTTSVTISGSHFGTNLTDTKVYFNGVEASITKVEDTKIECTVPAKAGTGVVKVEVNGKTVDGPAFTYIPTATVTTLAGSTEGFADGTGTAAKFFSPSGVALDAQVNLIVADALNNHSVRKVTPAGVVSTLARDNTAMLMNNPYGVAVDAQGNVYVASNGTHRILKITSAGAVSTYAGSGIGYHQDGNAATAQFTRPAGVAVDGQGNVYVADLGNNCVRKITSAGMVSTVAGSPLAGGYVDGPGATARLYGPIGIAVDNQGNLYVADSENHRIRKITPAGIVSTLAGSGSPGTADGTGTAARFTFPHGVAVDGQGNVYVADYGDHRIRKITPVGVVSTMAGTVAGYADGDLASAKFFYPIGVAIDATGNIYVGDSRNTRIRKITME